MTLRQCGTCQRWRPADEFTFQIPSADGRGTVRQVKICRPCRVVLWADADDYQGSEPVNSSCVPDVIIMRGQSGYQFPKSSSEDMAGFSRRVKDELDADPEKYASVETTGLGAGILDWLQGQGCRATARGRLAGAAARDPVFAMRADCASCRTCDTAWGPRSGVMRKIADPGHKDRGICPQCGGDLKTGLSIGMEE